MDQSQAGCRILEVLQLVENVLSAFKLKSMLSEFSSWYRHLVVVACDDLTHEAHHPVTKVSTIVFNTKS